jgi:hypothetical protein
MSDHVKDLLRRVTIVRDLLTEAITEYEKNKPIEPIIPIIPVETITKEEYDELMWELDGYAEIVKSIQKFYKIDTLESLPRGELRNTKEKIRKIKKAFDEYVNT